MKNRIILLIIPFLLLVTNASAAVTWSQYSYFKSDGGINNAFSPISIEDNEASDLQNIVFTTYGSFKKRSGFSAINEDNTGASTGIKYFKLSDGTEYLVGIFTDDKIYKMDYGASGPDGTWDDITGALSFAVTQNNLASFAIGEDTLIIEDGLSSTAPYQWTGTGNCAALSVSAPKATMVAFFKNMAFAAGNEDAPSTLYFSDIGNITAWSTGLAGNVGVETNDGSIIRAIMPGFDAIYIFKDNSIFRLTGSDKDSFQLQKMVNGIGVTSPQGVTLIGNQFFLITGQGSVYLYDGSIGVKKLSTKIAGTLKTDLSFSRYAYATTLTYDDDFYLAVSTSGSTTNDLVLLFDTFTLSWTKFKNMNVNAWTVANDGTGRDKVFFGDFNGTLCKYPQGDDDNGAAIDGYFVTKQFNYPELGPTKDLKLMRFFVAEQSVDYDLNVTLYKDFESTGTLYNISMVTGNVSVYGTAVYGVDVYGQQTIIIKRQEAPQEADFYKLKFQNEFANQSFEVYGYQLYVEKVDRQ